MPHRSLQLLAVAIVLFLTCTFAFAQSSSALINEALDKQVKLDIDATLPHAMQLIAQQTGVRLQATPDVWDLLPWGRQTNIKAKIENQTLREALTAITRRLGLEFTLQDEAVQVRPMAPLRRLGRRATIKELQVLDFLATTPLASTEPRMTVLQLLTSVDSRLEAADESRPEAQRLDFAVENRAFDHTSGEVALNVPRNATLFDALETVHRGTGATWYPWGRTLVVVPKEDQFRTQLNKTITIRFNGVDIAQVLTELASRSGVDFIIEPGAIQRVPTEARIVRLMLDNATIAQALETLGSFTGLAHSVTDRGVYIWNPTADRAAAPREPMFGMITLDNGMQVFIPQSQIPADLREYLQHKTRRELENLRQMMQEEGFEPSQPEPATAPDPANEP